MKPRTIFLILAALYVVFGLLAGFEAVSAYATWETSPADLPRNQTLYINGVDWAGTPTNFNPLSSVTSWPSIPNILLTYESLFAYNQLTGALDPLLAESYAFSSDATSVTITLQDGTLWQDSQALTPDDVVSTYELAKTQPDIPYDDLYDYIDDIEATGARTLEITLNDDPLNPGVVKNFLATIRILPRHIWQPREASGQLSDYIDTDPLGSGPYKMINFSSESIILFRDDNYWGKAVFGLPTPIYLVHRLNLTGNDAVLAFQHGDVDLSGSVIMQVWNLGNNIGTWYSQAPYQYPGSIPLLIINVQKTGLNRPLVRRALAYSINYGAIATTVDYSSPVNSSLILPSGVESPLFNPTQVAQYGWEYDPVEAADIQNQLHAVKGPDGIYILPGGTRLGPWKIRFPDGWLEWQEAVNLVVQNAQTAGIDLDADFPSFADNTSRLQTGDFDITLWFISGSEASSPWARFHDMLDERGFPPIGGTATWNFGRFSNPAVAALLDQAGEALAPISVKSIYDQLDKIFMDNAVGIPLMYRPQDFYAFNTTHWVGFTTESHPSALPAFFNAGVELLYKIKAVQTVYLPVMIR